MNRAELKSSLISFGIAFLISVPIARAAMIAHGTWEPIIEEYQPIVIEYEYIRNYPEDEKRDELVKAEEDRKARIDNPYETRCEQGVVADPKAVLDFYQVNVPEDVKTYCEEAQKEFCVCAELLEAIAFAESSFDSSAINGDCFGLMQISTKWHQERMSRLGVNDIYDTRGNIRVAADYLRELFQRFDGDLYKVLMTYNGDTSEGVSDYALEIEEIAIALELVHGK